MILNPSNSKATFSNENNIVIFLNSSPKVFRDVKNAIIYGRTELTVDAVINSLESKDPELKT